MTRLHTEDIKDISRELKSYDKQLLDKTGKTLKGIACHAVGLPEDELEKIAESFKICAIPMTCGLGLIGCFPETVSAIANHLGFNSFTTQNLDAAGIAEAFEKKTDIILLADDNRFIAINVHTGHVSDNIEMTARGFVAGLDLMTAGLRKKTILVIGCGEVGCHTAKTLVTMGVQVTVSDIDPQLALVLQKKIAHETKTEIQIDNTWHSTPGKYRYIIDATPSTDLIVASMITPETYIAVPGVPCGLTSEAREKLSDRYLHDPLQIGVAAMVMDACKQ